MCIELTPIRGTRTQGALLDEERPRQRTQLRVASRKKGAPRQREGLTQQKGLIAEKSESLRRPKTVYEVRSF